MKKVVSTSAPRGVIGIISPWNFPLVMTLGEALPALMAGNAVAEQAEVVEALVEIVKSINNRTYVIGNSIKFLQFTNGVGG